MIFVEEIRLNVLFLSYISGILNFSRKFLKQTILSSLYLFYLLKKSGKRKP